MTRRLRPPVPLRLQCGTDGQPCRVHRGGHTYWVTHVANSWVQASLWWGDTRDDPLLAERTYYRIILDGRLVYDVFCAADRWFLERIID